MGGRRGRDGQSRSLNERERVGLRGQRVVTNECETREKWASGLKGPRRKERQGEKKGRGIGGRKTDYGRPRETS